MNITPFRVRRTKDDKTFDVYSIQMIVGQTALGQPAPIVVFLIYNTETERWELEEANDFVPADVIVTKKEKTPIMGSDSIILTK